MPAPAFFCDALADTILGLAAASAACFLDGVNSDAIGSMLFLINISSFNADTLGALTSRPEYLATSLSLMLRPLCLGRLGLRFRDVDCIGLWLSSPRCTWSRQDLLSLCFHGTLTAGRRGHSSSMASSTVASTSSGEGLPSSMLNPRHIYSVTASHEGDCLESLPGHLQADQLVRVCHAECVRWTPCLAF